ncbi:type III secretion system inner rod subunit SctI [Pleionea sediminis]|uniref:type III secretion system inner rod subunit SctI n=1 Tax=Pleionea sediminis TaxID=2569479 RepID=UPI0011848EA0|nr:type III secretion system inner rod subunit SctI [Pleionea sediminis]
MEPISEISQVTLNNDSLGEQTSGSLDASINGETDSLGDRFLKMLGDTKQHIGEKSAEIQEALTVEHISPAELLKVQYELAEIAIQQELISKGVSKSTQNVDTLLKAQ